VRRARLEVSGSFFQFITFRVEGDFTQSPSLFDAYLDFRFFPELRIGGGQFKEPFSLEELTGDLFIVAVAEAETVAGPDLVVHNLHPKSMARVQVGRCCSHAASMSRRAEVAQMGSFPRKYP
jgi:phosphate-selective porin